VKTRVETAFLDHERRGENQDVAVAAAASDEDAPVAEGTLHLPRKLRVGELDAEEEAAAADIADRRAPRELVP